MFWQFTKDMCEVPSPLSTGKAMEHPVAFRVVSSDWQAREDRAFLLVPTSYLPHFVSRSDDFQRRSQEVFQDGNDKLILEALVNFFFMGEDCETQVTLVTLFTIHRVPYVLCSTPTDQNLSPRPTLRGRCSVGRRKHFARLVLHAPFEVRSHVWRWIQFPM